MKLLLVTVGTSAITNDQIGLAPNRRDNRALREDVARYLDARDQKRSAHPALFDDLVAAHKRFWSAPEEYRRKLGNRRQTSAELYSTHCLVSKGVFRPDRVDLIASDTDDGEMAAAIVATLMRDAWQWRVAYQRVPGLDKNLADIDRTLERFFRETVPQGADVVVDITGGYKGTIPALTLAAKSYGWALYYQHEENNEAVCVMNPFGGQTVFEPIQL